MSIESNLESIAKSLVVIAASLANKEPVQALTPVLTSPAFVEPTPVQAVAPSEQAIAAVQAFAPPAFEQTGHVLQAAPTVQLPFNDTAGFTQYLIASFQKLEAKAPGTGGNIQRVIESIGCKNVNEVQPSSYAAVYAEVEKLVG
jgi:hypothetical protein